MIKLSYQGRVASVGAWARILGCSPQTLRERKRKGLSDAETLGTKIVPKNAASPRKLAKAKGELVYEGCACKNCGSELKYTAGGTCVFCRYDKKGGKK